MRFQTNKPLTQIDYDNKRKRTISKFLWFPKKVDCEIRWLEHVMIEQVVDFKIRSDVDTPRLRSTRVYFWKDSKWVDPPNRVCYRERF